MMHAYSLMHVRVRIGSAGAGRCSLLFEIVIQLHSCCWGESYEGHASFDRDSQLSTWDDVTLNKIIFGLDRLPLSLLSGASPWWRRDIIPAGKRERDVIYASREEPANLPNEDDRLILDHPNAGRIPQLVLTTAIFLLSATHPIYVYRPQARTIPISDNVCAAGPPMLYPQASRGCRITYDERAIASAIPRLERGSAGGGKGTGDGAGPLRDLRPPPLPGRIGPASGMQI
ncbi:hypothetical protein V8C40DRAFT_147771 [Trichoderma camerunense]